MADSSIFKEYDSVAPITKADFHEEMEKYIDQIVDRINKPNNDEIAIIKEQIVELTQRLDELENSSESEPNVEPPISEPSSNEPSKIIFKTGESYNIVRWFEIVPKTVKYLVKTGKFTLTDEVKNFVNTTPRTKNGSRYQYIQQVNGYYVNKYGTTNQLKDRVKLLLKSCGIDPNSALYECKKINEPKPSTLPRLFPPIKMTFPDGKEYTIKFWKDIITSTAVHFINPENLVLTEEIKDFVNTTPYTRTGSKYGDSVKFDNYYVNTHGASWQHQGRADLLMKAHNIDVNSIIYETENGEEYIKPTRSREHSTKKKSTRKRAPSKMIFLDGKVYEIKTWNKLIQSATRYLISIDKFILRDEFKDFINTEPVTKRGGKYWHYSQFDNYYVNTNAESWKHQERADLLLKAHNIDPSSIKYEY